VSNTLEPAVTAEPRRTVPASSYHLWVSAQINAYPCFSACKFSS